jgi:hypothetical protein
MLSFAILSLALAILIGLLCYGAVAVAVSYESQGTAVLAAIACIGMILWGLWFITQRWPITH